MNLKLFLLSFLIPFFVLSQSKKEDANSIVKEVSKQYNATKNYSYTMSYNFFESYTSNKVFESFNGLLIKNDKTIYFKLKDTEFLTFEDVSIKINNDEKALLMGKNIKSDSPLNLDDYLKVFNSKIVKSDASSWTIELLTKMTSQIMFNKIVFVVSKKNYVITKQILYFLNPSDEDKMSKPRLEIVFNPIKRDVRKEEALLSKSSYFISRDKDIKLAKKYNDYKIYNE